MNRTASTSSRNHRTKTGRSMVFLVAFGLLISLTTYTINVFKTNGTSNKVPNRNSNIASFFSPSVQYWADDITRWAKEYDLDPNLIATVMQIESCGDPSVVSGAGAIGLFQVMPFHFYASDDPYDPETNAARGLSYLSASFEQSGSDPGLAMAGYNGGLGVISLPYLQWYEETQRYYYWGSLIYEDAKNDLGSSPSHDDWMNSYGVSMCANAEVQLGSLP